MSDLSRISANSENTQNCFYTEGAVHGPAAVNHLLGLNRLAVYATDALNTKVKEGGLFTSSISQNK